MCTCVCAAEVHLCPRVQWLPPDQAARQPWPAALGGEEVLRGPQGGVVSDAGPFASTEIGRHLHGE